MYNTLFRNMVSAITILALVASIFAVQTISNETYAAEKEKTEVTATFDNDLDGNAVYTNDIQQRLYANAYVPSLSKCKVKFASSKNMKASGKKFKIGDLYGDGQEIVNDPSRYITGSSFYLPTKILVTTPKYIIKSGQRAKIDVITSGYSAFLKTNLSGTYVSDSTFEKYTITALTTDSNGQPSFYYVTNGTYKVTQKFKVKGAIKFVSNGGKLKKKSQKVRYKNAGAKYGKLPKVSKKGYKFKGWFTKKSGGKKVTSKTKLKKKVGATKVYAQWRKA